MPPQVAAYNQTSRRVSEVQPNKWTSRLHGATKSAGGLVKNDQITEQQLCGMTRLPERLKGVCVRGDQAGREGRYRQPGWQRGPLGVTRLGGGVQLGMIKSACRGRGEIRLEGGGQLWVIRQVGERLEASSPGL
uniref:Uncharacterized protein n=1 Tax=Pipistrellus kuhlii TaxID=59472 RepID=A0A7J7YMH5_PIPKU|nr:hypothetical protein mPipKuh1_010073 [Pipistrellus kuhlii]